MAILADGGRDPFYREFYRISLDPIGALAMDLIMPPMVRLIGLDFTGRLFVALTFLVMASGALALNRVLFKRVTAWPFFSFLLLYNGILIWGFINYLFAIGLFLWVLAAWFATEHRQGWLRTILFSSLCYGLLICHLYSFGLYGVCVMGAEVAQAQNWHDRIGLWRRKRFWLALAQFVPAAALFVLTSPTSGNLRSIGLFSTDLKLHGLSSLVHTGLYPLDLALSILGCLGYVAAVRRGWLVLDARLTWAVGGLFALFVLMPDVIFHAGFADYRLPLAIALIAIAATRPGMMAGRHETGQMLFLGLVLAAQVAYFAVRWDGFDQRYAALNQILDQVPRGQRVLGAFAQDDKLAQVNEPPIAYAPQLAVIRDHIFVNGAFVWPQDNSSLTLAAPYGWLQADRAWFTEYYPQELAAIAHDPTGSAVSPFRPSVLASFDYLLVRSPDRFPASVIKTFIPVAAVEDFALYRLR